jgi:hypothetical protein
MRKSVKKCLYNSIKVTNTCVTIKLFTKQLETRN